MSDYRETYIFSRRHLNKAFHIERRHKINTGLVFFPKRYYDLGVIDFFLKIVFDKNMHGRFPHMYWLEQAALAILMSKYAEHFLRLPKEYQISRQPITEETVSNHFVSDGSSPLFYASGLKRLEAAKILQKLGRN